MIIRKQYVQGLILIEAKNNYGKDKIKFKKLLQIEGAVYENLKEVFGDILIDETHYSDKVYDIESEWGLLNLNANVKLAIDEEEFKNIHDKQNQTNYIFSAVVTETEKLINKPVRSRKKKSNIGI